MLLERFYTAKAHDLSILLKMELASLPGNATKDSFTSSLQAFVSIAGDEFHSFFTMPAIKYPRPPTNRMSMATFTKAAIAPS